MQTIKVDEAQINYSGDGLDGFGAMLVIDKVELVAVRCILLKVIASHALRITAEFSDGRMINYEPNSFDLQLGKLRITIDPDRFPCRITIGNEEPRVSSLQVTFKEGAMVWISMVFNPYFS